MSLSPPDQPRVATTAGSPAAATLPAERPLARQRLGEFIGYAAPRRHWLVIGLRGLSLAAVPVGAAVILWVLIFRTGFGLSLITASALIALIPVPFLIFWFIWLDRFDPARWEYLGFAFVWGAFVATAISLGVNLLGAVVFAQYRIQGEWVAVWVAPVIEELTKGLAPLLLYLLWRREVVGLADAVMYAGLSATGFAMIENVLYLGNVHLLGEQLQGPLGGVAAVTYLVLLRLGLTGFIHPLFTSMTGIGIGLAARTRNTLLRWLYPLAGLLLAMTLHGAWNFTALLAQETEDVSVLGLLYFIVTLPTLFGFVVLGFRIRSAPGRAVRRVLPEYVRAGWLSPPELGMLVTLRRRLWARRWAREVAGPSGAAAMRAFQIASTRLALLREGRLHGIPHGEPIDAEHRLLYEITECRKQFVGRDRTTPVARWDGARYLMTLPDGKQRMVIAQHPFAMPVPVLPMPPSWFWQQAHPVAPIPGSGLPQVRPPTPIHTPPPVAGAPGSHGGHPPTAMFPPTATHQPGVTYPPPPGHAPPPGHVPPAGPQGPYPGYLPPAPPPHAAQVPPGHWQPGGQWPHQGPAWQPWAAPPPAAPSPAAPPPDVGGVGSPGGVASPSPGGSEAPPDAAQSPDPASSPDPAGSTPPDQPRPGA